jgi:branched-chain amino acid transport system permease protein
MALLTLTQRTPAHRVYRATGIVLATAALIYVPWFADKPARIDQYSQVVAYAVAIMALNLVIGFSGQISLGHSAFVGIGAYTTVILVADHDWSYFATIPVAFALSFAVGILVGLPALRIRGLYLAVVTLAVATVFPTLVIKYESLTGGPNGKQAPDKLVPPDWTPWGPRDRFGAVAYRYFVILAIAAVMFVVARNLLRSRVGRAVIALRDNQTSAATAGVNPAIYKTLMFGVSAAMAGVAGSLLMIQQPQATDTRFGIELAIFLVVALVIGGVATIAGAVPGALVYVFLPYYAVQWSENIGFLEGRPGAGAISGVIYGVLLLIFVFILPGGVMDGIRRLRARVVRIIPNPSWLPKEHAEVVVEEAPPSPFPELVSEPSPSDLTSTTTRGSTE